MPKAVSRRFTDTDRDKVEKFMIALLEYKKNETKIEAEWTIGNPEPHHLVVKKTTKEDLVRVIYNPNCAGKELETYKGFIQTAMAYLEEDLKILVRQSTKIGADAKNLKFYLRLPSKNKEEIFRIFEEKWTARRQEIEAMTSKPCENKSKIEVEQVSVGVEGETIKWALKFKGDIDAMRRSQKQMNQYVKALTEDPTNKIVFIGQGCVIVEFESSLEGFKRLESKIKSGEITEILGFPILDIQQIDELESSEARDIGFKLTQWFDNIKVDDWLYDIRVQAAKLALKSYQNLTENIRATAPITLRATPMIIDRIAMNSAFFERNNPSQDNPLQDYASNTSQNGELSLTVDELNSDNKYSILMSAYELGKFLENFSNIPQDFINLLATRITTIEDSETRWQLALTLGKLDPEHPLGAVGQTKTIEFPTDDWFDLFLALRVGEDDLIDVLIEVTSATDEYLPVGLQVSLLDETEEIFSKAIANEEERYLSLEFTGAIGQFFSVKISLWGNDLIENFVI
ncbi:DUF1822 family protein [Planktothrix sp. FACHB-1365]|uniref:DUF1822 family protein n=1 Tax=Planktothrix sp. FACHB-1365 TaxID=2692855 RepID=UPI0016822081|nr:DUF1822 family protein [Planktothrix sp. FACHB-1365]MBD2483909.1 DUF1822 family protein [Planktothrix sp. FACHB-1365]